MDDLISRQAAIDAVDVYMKRLCRYIGTSDDTMVYAFARGLLVGIKTDIGELPSAQPEPATTWLNPYSPYTCEKCGFHVDSKTRYCPDCGRKAVNYEN